MRAGLLEPAEPQEVLSRIVPRHQQGLSRALRTGLPIRRPLEQAPGQGQGILEMRLRAPVGPVAVGFVAG